MITNDNSVETDLSFELTKHLPAPNNNTTNSKEESAHLDVSQINLFFNFLDEKKISFGVRKL